ncbi:IPT/TIG domain-containing protein [Rhizobium subbaraonis]|uniref:IPT/TIG domain-containing protein n=1 Tax=Rhizobium subbaraonis TaxID=908946 RepID=UPI00387E5DD1
MASLPSFSITGTSFTSPDGSVRIGSKPPVSVAVSAGCVICSAPVTASAGEPVFIPVSSTVGVAISSAGDASTVGSSPSITSTGWLPAVTACAICCGAGASPAAALGSTAAGAAITACAVSCRAGFGASSPRTSVLTSG